MTSCKHENSISTRREQSNGVIVVFLQCQECGGGRAIKKEGVNLTLLPPYDPSIQERYSRRWMDEFNQRTQDFNDGIVLQKNQEREEWWAGYTAYLQSDHWRAVRRLVLRRDPVCQKCLLAGSEQAHHLTYATFNHHGFSFPAECVGVCVSCHEAITLKSREAREG